MADDTLSKLIHLLGIAGSTPLRLAAVRVSGSLGTAKERALVKALLAVLQETDLELRVSAIEALGQLGADEALTTLESVVRLGGPELEAAVQAASQLGARGIRAMSKIMAQATPALRSRMAAVLAKSGTGGGLVATAHALLDADAKVVDAAARSLAAEVPGFTSPQKQALAKFLSESLGAKDRLSAKTEAAMIRLLGTLHDAKAGDLFWARVGPSNGPEVRAAALQALGNQALDTKTPPVTDAGLQRLVECAAAADFQIVAPALMLLKNVPASAKNAKLWLKLLEAPDVATRRFAVDKLNGVETADVARGLLLQLGHADRALREEARQALLRFAKGRQALLDKLVTAESMEEGWDLARALAPAAKELGAVLRTRLLEQAFHLHDKDDRRAAPLWFFLREMESGWVRDQIEERALSLRKQKKFAESVNYLRLLAQDPACSEDSRFELAAAGLRISRHETSVEARQADPALGHFARLLQNPAFDLQTRINKAKWLDEADLFYLGFHFVEQTHRARDFGKQVLELVVKRAPKSEFGKNARKKLKSSGLA